MYKMITIFPYVKAFQQNIQEQQMDRQNIQDCYDVQ